jgi:hypothetical protein
MTASSWHHAKAIIQRDNVPTVSPRHHTTVTTSSFYHDNATILSWEHDNVTSSWQYYNANMAAWQPNDCVKMLLLDVGLYFVRITHLRFDKITATYTSQILRRGYSGLIMAKMLETKAMGWVQNSSVLSQYICTQLSRASFSDQTAQQAWAGFFSVHKNRF